MHPLGCFVFGQEVTLSWRNVTWPLRGRSAACHNYPPGPLTSSFGEHEKKKKKEPVSPEALGSGGCHRKRRLLLAEPLSAHQRRLHDTGRQPDILLTGDRVLDSGCL